MEIYGLDSSGSEYGKLVASCKHGNRKFVSIKCGTLFF
jgi:hypothetical protein